MLDNVTSASWNRSMLADKIFETRMPKFGFLVMMVVETWLVTKGYLMAKKEGYLIDNGCQYDPLQHSS